jgi:hypothetical protein
MACNDRGTGNKGRYSEMVNVGGKWKRRTTAEAFTIDRGTILSDSICQLVQNCVQTKTQAIHGGVMANFPMYCRRGSCTVRNFKILIFHYGTNDLRTDIHFTECADRIVASLDRSIAYIQGINPNGVIAVSGILPRPKELKKGETDMEEARVYANVAMRGFCEQHGIEYLTSETCLKGQDPTKEIYANDGIHLSFDGATYLQNYFEGRVSELLGIYNANMAAKTSSAEPQSDTPNALDDYCPPYSRKK